MPLSDVPQFLHKNEFKFIGKLDCRWVIYQYPNTINAFQWQICCLNSKTFSKSLCFVIRNVRRTWKIRYSIHFLAQQKELLNKQNSLNRYYSTYLRFLEGFRFTTTTIQFPWRLCYHHDDHTRYVFINTLSNNL